MDTQLQMSLPENTLQLIDTLIRSNQMSVSLEETQKEQINFIDEAIQFYLVQKQQNNLKQQLKEGAIRRANGI